jgi:hypothetical protein
MSVTRQPTSNQSADPGQGGSAVTTPSNTGHASTICSAGPGASTTKSCKWTGFADVSGSRSSVKLLFDWVQNGDVSDGSSNQFRIQYSINGGSNWNTVFDHTGFQGSSSNNNEQVTLSNSQDLTQVQVRDLLFTASNAENGSAMTATVSNIRIEVEQNNGLAILAGGT